MSLSDEDFAMVVCTDPVCTAAKEWDIARFGEVPWRAHAELSEDLAIATPHWYLSAGTYEKIIVLDMARGVTVDSIQVPPTLRTPEGEYMSFEDAGLVLNPLSDFYQARSADQKALDDLWDEEGYMPWEQAVGIRTPEGALYANGWTVQKGWGKFIGIMSSTSPLDKPYAGPEYQPRVIPDSEWRQAKFVCTGRTSVDRLKSSGTDHGTPIEGCNLRAGFDDELQAWVWVLTGILLQAEPHGWENTALPHKLTFKQPRGHALQGQGDRIQCYWIGDGINIITGEVVRDVVTYCRDYFRTCVSYANGSYGGVFRTWAAADKRRQEWCQTRSERMSGKTSQAALGGATPLLGLSSNSGSAPVPLPVPVRAVVIPPMAEVRTTTSAPILGSLAHLLGDYITSEASSDSDESDAVHGDELPVDGGPSSASGL